MTAKCCMYIHLNKWNVFYQRWLPDFIVKYEIKQWMSIQTLLSFFFLSLSHVWAWVLSTDLNVYIQHKVFKLFSVRFWYVRRAPALTNKPIRMKMVSKMRNTFYKLVYLLSLGALFSRKIWKWRLLYKYIRCLVTKEMKRTWTIF